jgi:hypothetical protein
MVNTRGKRFFGTKYKYDSEKLKRLETPVLFLIFNRPDLTQKVFNEIKKAKPLELYVAADGPRENVRGEKEKCEKTREIIKKVDWDCDVHTLFRRENLGCKIAVSSAIDWFFDHVKEGIILEDDCFPSQSFFRFCQALLNKYRFHDNIMHINGNNFGKLLNINSSYDFCSYPHVWGWATWKRAWSHYDVKMKGWKDLKIRGKVKKNMKWNIFKYKLEENKFNRTYKNEMDTWDYQWQYTIYLNHGIVICPQKNLISNIGFDHDATHTLNKNSLKANLNIYKIDFPLNHPHKIHINKQCNDLYGEYMIGRKPSLIFLRKKINPLFNLLQKFNLDFSNLFRELKKRLKFK